MPVWGQLFDPTTIFQFANPCQSVPIHVNPVPIGQSGANRPIRSQSAKPVPIGQSVPIRCQLANPVPIGQSSANPVPIGQSGANPVPISQFRANRLIQCQSGANSPIQRQSCTEIAYYGMPVGPSVNGRAVDRCNATESGLAQHWSALASSPANPGNSNLSNKLLCGLLIGLLGG